MRKYVIYQAKSIESRALILPKKNTFNILIIFLSEKSKDFTIDWYKNKYLAAVSQ